MSASTFPAFANLFVRGLTASARGARRRPQSALTTAAEVLESRALLTALGPDAVEPPAEEPPADTTAPMLLGAELQADGRTIVVQFNDDDLDPATINSASIVLLAGNGDANGDGNLFNDGDETAVALESLSYDAATDQVTVRALDALFGNHYLLSVDGDAVTDLAGNGVDGGDQSFTFDRTASVFARELLDLAQDVEAMPNIQRQIQHRAAKIVHLIENTRCSPRAVQVHLRNFERMLDRLERQGKISQEDHDLLVPQIEVVSFAVPTQPGPKLNQYWR